MNQKEANYRYVAEQACTSIGLTHEAVKEKFKILQVCCMHYVEKGMTWDAVEVRLSMIEATIKFDISDTGICFHARIRFDKPTDEAPFICHLVKTADYYSYREKGWLMKGEIFIELEDGVPGLDFLCYRKESHQKLYPPDMRPAAT